MHPKIKQSLIRLIILLSIIITVLLMQAAYNERGYLAFGSEIALVIGVALVLHYLVEYLDSYIWIRRDRQLTEEIKEKIQKAPFMEVNDDIFITDISVERRNHK